MNKDEELELKVKMFCAAINPTVYEGSVGRIRAITEEVNIAFEMLKRIQVNVKTPLNNKKSTKFI